MNVVEQIKEMGFNELNSYLIIPLMLFDSIKFYRLYRRLGMSSDVNIGQTISENSIFFSPINDSPYRLYVNTFQNIIVVEKVNKNIIERSVFDKNFNNIGTFYVIQNNSESDDEPNIETNNISKRNILLVKKLVENINFPDSQIDLIYSVPPVNGAILKYFYDDSIPNIIIIDIEFSHMEKVKEVFEKITENLFDLPKISYIYVNVDSGFIVTDNLKSILTQRERIITNMNKIDNVIYWLSENIPVYRIVYDNIKHTKITVKSKSVEINNNSFERLNFTTFNYSNNYYFVNGDDVYLLLTDNLTYSERDRETNLLLKLNEKIGNVLKNSNLSCENTLYSSKGLFLVDCDEGTISNVDEIIDTGVGNCNYLITRNGEKILIC